MHFLRLFLAFIQKLCLISFHFSKIDKGGVGIRAGRGRKIFQKLIRGGGRLFGTREYHSDCEIVTVQTPTGLRFEAVILS